MGLHVAIAGLGRIGALHARTLATRRLAQRVTILEPVDQLAELAHDELVAAGIEVARADSVEELMQAGPDALVVATPTPTHAEMISSAVEARLPVFCEKPIALGLDETREVVARAEAQGTLVQIGFQRRFDPGFQAAREIVAGGQLGELYMVRSGTHDPSPPPPDYIAGSGGMYRDQLIHDFDAIRFVTGREVGEVTAVGSAGLVDEAFVAADDVDVSAVVLRLEGDALCVLTAARHDPLGYDVRLELFGSRDSVSVGDADRDPIRRIGQQAPSSSYQDFVERFSAAYVAELEAFVQAVVAEAATCGSTARDALLALEIADAADRSRRTGCTVALGG